MARRLYTVRQERAPKAFKSFDWIGKDATDDWLRVADECIRLMEWAKQSALESAATLADEVDVSVQKPHMVSDGYRPLGVGGDIRSREMRDEPLTLPPDDWRPEGEK